jgi:hypothetical protein
VSSRLFSSLLISVSPLSPLSSHKKIKPKPKIES